MKLEPCEMAGLLDKHGYDFLKRMGLCDDWIPLFNEKQLREELAKLEKVVDYTPPGRYCLKPDDWDLAYGLVHSGYTPDKTKGMHFLYKLGFINGYLATIRGQVKTPPELVKQKIKRERKHGT